MKVGVQRATRRAAVSPADLRFRRPRRIALGLLAGGLLLLGAGGPASAADIRAQSSAAAGRSADETFDVRAARGGGRVAQASAAQRGLRRALGASGVVDTDPLTGGLTVVARRNGFLTRAAADRPRDIALSYLRERRAAFGLDSTDIASLELTRRYASGSGAVHLWWEQTYRGIPSFDQGLRANVDADGRLINIGGAPRPDLAVDSIVPGIGPRQALEAAALSVSASTFDRGQRASLVIFGDAQDVRLAWRVLLFTGDGGVYDAVVDADSGRLLYRASLIHDIAARAFDNFPGAPVGGTQVAKDFPPAWLSSTTRLIGPNTHVHSDVEDDIYTSAGGPMPGVGDEIPPTGGTWNYTQTTFPAATPCPPTAGCSWNSSVGLSWDTNREQAGTQLFYFVNNFHDYLRDAPGIEFGASSGSFEGLDPVLAQVDDGADGPGGRPDCAHSNNANMAVLPDGTPARMQMYLFRDDCPSSSGVRDVNGADDAHIVYHEYTHGLSNRLVTDVAGFGALDGAQSGAMGEAWSDFYAEDYLAGAGFQTDTAAPGEIRSSTYVNAPIRTQAFDCAVGSGPPACPGTPGAGPGGYTYGDFAKILGFAEVHADGEIWVEALWDLRQSLIAAHGAAQGTFRVRALVTDGMRLSPPSPTFLQMRDAILQADVNRGFVDRDRIWAVFAARGMGLNATTTGDNDTAPVEDFTAPPPLPPPPSADTKRPVVSRFSMTNTRFRVGLDRTPRVAAAQRPTPIGTRFGFRLSERAKVVIKLQRARPGRKVGRSCRRPTRRLSSRKRCTRYVTVGSLVRRNRAAGRVRVNFSGRIGVKALPLGLHRASATAEDAAGNVSRPRRVRFRVVRR